MLPVTNSTVKRSVPTVSVCGQRRQLPPRPPNRGSATVGLGMFDSGDEADQRRRDAIRCLRRLLSRTIDIGANPEILRAQLEFLRQGDVKSALGILDGRDDIDSDDSRGDIAKEHFPFEPITDWEMPS